MSTTSLGRWSSTDDVIRAYPAQAEDIKNQTIIITGSNTGIGKETARVLASLGGNIILACRNQDKGNTAAADINALHPDCTVSCLPLDLSSGESIRAFAELFNQRRKELVWPPLQILILNAGVFPLNGHSLSQDGFEGTFATNHLGNFLLTKLLLPQLRDNQNSRVVVLASDSHRGPLLVANMCDKEDVLEKVVHCSKSHFSVLGAYGTSKLCNVLFASYLHRQEAFTLAP